MVSGWQHWQADEPISHCARLGHRKFSYFRAAGKASGEVKFHSFFVVTCAQTCQLVHNNNNEMLHSFANEQ